jgi:hypothetical protein
MNFQQISPIHRTKIDFEQYHSHLWSASLILKDSAAVWYENPIYFHHSAHHGGGYLQLQRTIESDRFLSSAAVTQSTNPMGIQHETAGNGTNQQNASQTAHMDSKAD